jgi:hypothetical protein
MRRLPRFPDNRYIGHRDVMTVYDCDQPEQFAAIAEIGAGLGFENSLQAFAPDDLLEARNRGFKIPPSRPESGGSSGLNPSVG